jgi:hypothetical protein
MASWCEDAIQEALDELSIEVPKYLAAVDTFRELGCEPKWSNEGEFTPTSRKRQRQPSDFPQNQWIEAWTEGACTCGHYRSDHDEVIGCVRCNCMRGRTRAYDQEEDGA